MFEFLEKYIMNPLTKFSQRKFVRAITRGGMSTIGITIVGSLFLVLNILPDVIPALQGFYDNTLYKVSDIYMLAFSATMNLIALYFAAVISYEYCTIIRDEEDVDVSPIQAVVLGIFSFVMTIPQFSSGEGLKRLNDPANNILNGWAIGDAPSRMGGTGVFIAIVMAYISVNMYKWCIKRNFVIRMPESVPEGVSNSFISLIPAFIIALAIMIIDGILISLGTDLFEVISIPFEFVTKLTNSWLGLLVIMFLWHALWVVGIHGSTVIGSLVGPIQLVNLTQNQQGARIPFAGDLTTPFIIIGGAGCTLGLVLLMAFAAKSEHFKTLGKAAIVPGIFNINEPIIFGLPIVYNPDFIVPFIGVPLVNATISYFAIKSGFMNPIVAQQPWPTPVGLGGFIATGGDWKAIIVSLICLAASVLIYFPFFKRTDNRLYAEQLAEENNVDITNIVIDDENNKVKIVENKEIKNSEENGFL